MSSPYGEEPSTGDGGGLFLFRELKVVYADVPRGPAKPCITSSRDVREFACETLGLCDEVVEHFVVLLLDAKCRPIGWNRVAQGGLNVCPVTPTDLFRAVLTTAASSIIIIHNHPSGDPSPSSEDIALTERIVRASELLGIRVFDHVIVAGLEHFSFFDAGLMEPPRG